MAKACATMGRITVEANMGAIGAIMRYGTHEQKQRAAACVLAGDKPAICISEPQAGSAASEMATRAVRHGDDYLINGEKYWITGGGVSRLHLIFARVIEDGATRASARSSTSRTIPPSRTGWRSRSGPTPWGSGASRRPICASPT